MAVKLFGSAASRLHQSSLPSSGSAVHGKAGECLIRRTAVVRTRMPGGVGGAAPRDAPLSRLTAASTAPCSPRSGGRRPAPPSTQLLAPLEAPARMRLLRRLPLLAMTGGAWRKTIEAGLELQSLRTCRRLVQNFCELWVMGRRSNFFWRLSILVSQGQIGSIGNE